MGDFGKMSKTFSVIKCKKLKKNYKSFISETFIGTSSEP